MSLWINDSQLFLYKPYISNNAPAQIWRCQNMTASVPLKAADFIGADWSITKSTVTSRLDLVGASSSWSEQNYNDLLAYIRDKHFLVNCKGEIFVENFPFDDINNQTIDPSTIVYLRAADAINMKNFGFLSPPKLPIRKIKYLDSNPVKNAEMVGVGRPKFDPSWMNHNWESDWVDINGLELKYSFSDYAPNVEVTKAGFRFVDDDNTTNVRKDYFYGIMFNPSNTPKKEGYMVVAGLGDRITQARFNPNIWGLYRIRNICYPTRKFFSSEG